MAHKKPVIKRVRERISKQWVWCLYFYSDTGKLIPVAANSKVKPLCDLLKVMPA